MESFTIELVSNASARLFPDNTLSSFTNFLPEQPNLRGQWEVAISEISNPSRYQNVTEGKIMFLNKKLSMSSEFVYREPGLYSSITDIIEAMNTFNQERHNHSENCITVKVSEKTQKVSIYLANERSGLAFFSADLGHFFGNMHLDRNIHLEISFCEHYCFQMKFLIPGTVEICSRGKKRTFLTAFVLIMNSCFIQYNAPLV